MLAISQGLVTVSPLSRESTVGYVSNDKDDAVKTEDEPVYCPNRNEFLQIMETMQKFSFFQKIE